MSRASLRDWWQQLSSEFEEAQPIYLEDYHGTREDYPPLGRVGAIRVLEY
jgi:hypothetical protein